MEKELFNVAVRRDNGNTYVGMARATNWEEAMQIVRSEASQNDKVLSAYVARYRGETFQYGNFLVTRVEDDLFDIYTCTSRGQKIGRKITNAESLSKAIKKAKLLQRGFEECLKSERISELN